MTQATFLPSRAAALERLARFIPHAGRAYAARRNYDLGAGNHDAVSTLSPWLRCRLITEQEVIASVLNAHNVEAAEKFIQEVFWRTYWKGWLERRPQVWQMYQADLNRAWNEVQTQDGLRARWQAACSGATDIDCFNTWAQELVSTGYLHNHARMWFASIWIFTLKLPWALGADFFLRHLLDGDPASNTLSWRWVAGMQTVGKTYLARASNISKFTEGRFQPDWQLALEAPPLPAPPPPDPRPLPEPIMPERGLRTGFLLHDEDLSPEFILRTNTPCATAVLAPQTKVGPLSPAPCVTGFRASAMDDAAGRWSGKLSSITQAADAQAVLNWARSEDLQQVVTAYAPTGPTATVLDALDRMEQMPPLIRIMRPYDKETWQHATKGFFNFKKRIPDFILHFGKSVTT